jgi:hypothetical protein
MPSFVKIDTGVEVIWRAFLRNWYLWWEGFMKYAVEMGCSAMIYKYQVSWRLVQTFKSFWVGGYTYRHEDTQQGGFVNLLLFFKNEEIRLMKIRICTKELHILSHIRSILTTLPWKRNLLLLSRPLLLDELRATVRSVWSLKPVSRKWAFHHWAPFARNVTFLKLPHMQLYSGT